MHSDPASHPVRLHPRPTLQDEEITLLKRKLHEAELELGEMRVLEEQLETTTAELMQSRDESRLLNQRLHAAVAERDELQKNESVVRDWLRGDGCWAQPRPPFCTDFWGAA